LIVASWVSDVRGTDGAWEVAATPVSRTRTAAVGERHRSILLFFFLSS
jgi:hypothetical protein